MTELLSGIIAGILSTFAMTLFMRFVSWVTKFNFHVPTILGTMLTFETKPSGTTSDSSRSIVAGYALHYTIGILFVIIYQQVWLEEHIGTMSSSLLFGAIIGLAGVGFWITTLKLHPLAPSVNLKLYLIFLFLGHIVFALTMHIVLYCLQVFKL